MGEHPLMFTRWMKLDQMGESAWSAGGRQEATWWEEPHWFETDVKHMDARPS